MFLTNRGLEDPANVDVLLADRAIIGLDSAKVLTGPDAKAANSFERPDVVRPRSFTDVKIDDGQATLSLPPLSATAMTFRFG